MCRILIPSGACLRYTEQVKMPSIMFYSVFENEINSVTDNPTIFPDEDLIISAGNFHGQPLALAADQLAIAMAEIGNISERTKPINSREVSEICRLFS